MQKFPFVENALVIYEIARAQKVDIDVAYDMLRADIVNGVNSNTQRDDIDFIALQTAWSALGEEKQEEARQAWKDFYYANFKELTAAWTSDDRAAFQAIIDNA